MKTMNEFGPMSLSTYPKCLTVCVCVSWEVMQCSAAMDILFLMDGSYSVGKGSFERSKHYAIKLSQALDIGPDTVCFSFRSVFLPLSLVLIVHHSCSFHRCPGASRVDSVWFDSSAGVRPGLTHHQRGAEEAHEEGFL